MFHSNTQQLIQCWRERCGARRAPTRADIQLVDVGRLAPWCFAAEATRDGDIRFRFAGEALIDLHGRPLAGESAPALWRTDRRPLVSQALGISLTVAEPVVMTARGRADGGAVARLELLFAPLTGPDGRLDRFIGLCQPLAPVTDAPIEPLDLLTVNGALALERGRTLRLAAADGRLT